jgi:mRNA interferase MazF
MASTDAPRRREVWLVALGAGRAGGPGKTRPAIVVSSDELWAPEPAARSGAQAGLIVVVPLSSSLAPSALRVDVAPIAGIDRPSRAVCRAVRALVSTRFVRRLGSIDQVTMEQIETALALILELDHRPPRDR